MRNLCLIQLSLFERRRLDDLLGNKAHRPTAPAGDEVRVALIGQQWKRTVYYANETVNEILPNRIVDAS